MAAIATSVRNFVLILQTLIIEMNLEDVKAFITRNLSTTLVVGSCIGIYWLLKKPRGLPPGPRWTLPIVGDILSVIKKSDDGDPRLIFRRLNKKYGDIYSVYLGPKLFIVLSGYPMIKDALVKHEEMFSDRPPIYIIDTLSKRKGIVGSSGQVWKEQRKFTLKTLREFGFGRTILEDKIHEEIGMLVANLGKQNGIPFEIDRLIQSSIANIMCNLVHGHRFEYNDPLFLSFLEKLEENIAVVSSTGFINMLPFLRFIPGDPFKVHRTVRNVNFVEKALHWNSIHDHYKNYDDNITDDFISSYIKQTKKDKTAGIKSSINDENLVKCSNDLFLAGTETTSTTILWTILYFLHYPKVYQTCYKEIQDVIGSGRLPSMKDKPKMPYIEAVTMEISRINNVVIFGVPHGAARDTLYQGFFIPKSAIIITNLDSVLASNEVWGDADEFRPERFLDDDGQITKRDEWIPFGIGRRVCLGEAMAKMELFLYLTTLVQRFDFQPEDPSNLPPLKGRFGVTHSPDHYQVKVVPRK